MCGQAATAAIRQMITRCATEAMDTFCGRIIETFDQSGCAPTVDYDHWTHRPKFIECFDAESRKQCSCVRGQSVSVYISCTLE